MIDPWTALTAIGTFLGGAGAAKGAFDPEGGGGGGGVSSQTQTGNAELQFTPVGLETLDIPEFDYAFLDQIYQDEELKQDQQQMRYGGPLYASEGMPIDSGGIVDLFDPTLMMDVDLTATDVEPTTTTESLKIDLENILTRQKRQDNYNSVMEALKLISEAKKAFDPEKTGGVKGRGSVVPGAAAGGFRSKPNKLAIEEIGINPFEYRAMKGGGGVLNREMFAQNYMPNGGDIKGPGGPKDDLIPVMASNGEFMLSKAAVDQAGGGNHSKGIARLEAFNNLGNRRYG
jgi:hypothetical protein